MPDQELRRKQPGQRQEDVENFRKAALFDAVVEDRMFPSWKKEDVIKWLTILSLAGGIAVAIITFFSLRYATRREMTDQTRPVLDSIKVVKDTVTALTHRVVSVERKQVEVENAHQLLPASMRLQCLQLERDQSMSLAARAALPCDSLLKHVR